jgi:hypothetical protein
MESRKYCAYNRTQGSFLSLRIAAIDVLNQSSNEQIQSLADNSQSGLWLSPYIDLPAGHALLVFDLVYLDRDYRVVSVESFPNPASKRPAEQVASALALPPRTLTATQTQPGDELIIWSLAETQPESSRESKSAQRARAKADAQAAAGTQPASSNNRSKSVLGLQFSTPLPSATGGQEEEKAASAPEDSLSRISKVKHWIANRRPRSAAAVPVSILAASPAPASSPSVHISPEQAPPAQGSLVAVAPPAVTQARIEPAAIATVKSTLVEPAIPVPAMPVQVTSAPITPLQTQPVPTKPVVTAPKPIAPASVASAAETLVKVEAGPVAAAVNAPPQPPTTVSAAPTAVKPALPTPAQAPPAPLKRVIAVPGPVGTAFVVQSSETPTEIEATPVNPTVIAAALDPAAATAVTPAPITPKRATPAPIKPVVAVPEPVVPALVVPTAEAPAEVLAAPTPHKSEERTQSEKPAAEKGASQQAAILMQGAKRDPERREVPREQLDDEKKVQPESEPMPRLGSRFLRWLNAPPKAAERLRSPEIVAYFWTGGTPHPHKIGNISVTGLYLLTKDRWLRDTVLLMNLQLKNSEGTKDGDSLSVLARVVWSGADGVGFQFVTSESVSLLKGQILPGKGADRKALDKFLRRYGRLGGVQSRAANPKLGG